MVISFLGCIGYIMAGSGINKGLTTIYGPYSIDKLLNGHVYSRCIRAVSYTHLDVYKRQIINSIVLK